MKRKIKRKIITKLLAITLATTSAFSILSTGLTLPVSASWRSLAKLNTSSLYDLYKDTNRQNKCAKIIKILDDLKEQINNLKSEPSREEVLAFNSKRTESIKQLKNLDPNIAKLITDMCNAASNAPEIATEESQKNNKKCGIRDWRETYTFIKGILNKLQDPNLQFADDVAFSNYFDLSKYCTVSNQDYNDIMSKQFDRAISDENIKKSGDKIDELYLKLNTFDPAKNQIAETSISEITIPVDKIRHIVVGSPLPQPQLAFGHTKYAEDGLKKIIEYRCQRINNYPVAGLKTYFQHCTNTQPDEYTELSKDTALGGSSIERSYLSLNTHTYQKKGLFPDSWGWSEIKKAIKSILQDPTSLKYEHTKYEKDKLKNDKLKGHYSFFFGKYQDIPMTVIVDANRKELITAFPISEDAFTDAKAKNKIEPNFHEYN